jgi:hypothetical protein
VELFALDRPRLLQDEVKSAWATAINQIAPVVAGMSAPQGLPFDEICVSSLLALSDGAV